MIREEKAASRRGEGPPDNRSAAPAERGLQVVNRGLVSSVSRRPMSYIYLPKVSSPTFRLRSPAHLPRPVALSNQF
eukprot:2982749-Rhodomonas_salina.1